MSNCWLNLRILLWHLQITDEWRIHFSRNDYHLGFKDGYIRLYDFRFPSHGPCRLTQAGV